MKKLILLLAVAGVICSPLFVTSAEAKSAKLHKAHKHAHHALHHKSKHHKKHVA